MDQDHHSEMGVLHGLVTALLGAGLGVQVFLSFLVVPAAFRVVERPVAVQVMEGIFPGYYGFGLTTLAMALALVVVLAFREPAPLPWGTVVLVGLSLVGMVYAGHMLLPAAHAALLRAQAAPAGDLAVLEFSRLYRRAVAVNIAIFATGAIALALHVGVGALGSSPTVKRWWAIFAVFGLLFYFNAYVCDDAFITFRAVDNFVRGYGLRWNAADRVQVFTSPLFTVLFAVPYSVIFDRSAIPNPSRAYWLAIALSFVLSMGIVVSLGRAIERRSTFIALFAVLMASQAFVTFTSSGLETPLCLLVVALFYGRWLRGDPREMRGYGWLLALAAAAVLTRQDLALLTAPAALQLVITGWRRYGRRLLAPVAAATAPLVAWHAFSLVYYGFLLPNSYYAKLGLDAPSSLVWSQGRHYFAECLRQDPVTVAVCGMALLVCVTNRRLVIAGAGVLMHLLYICSIGGDFLGCRFLAPPFLLSVLILANCLDAVETRRPLGLWRIAVGAAAVYSLVVPHSPVRAIVQGPSMPDVAWYYPASAVSRWRPDVAFPFAKFLRVENADHCRRLRATTPEVSVPGDGLNGFCRGPLAHLLDPFGIADPLTARLSIRVTRPFQPAHIRKPLPAGYQDSALDGGSRIADPGVAAFNAQLRLITRGPLWSAERWRAIWRMNFTADARFRRPYS